MTPAELRTAGEALYGERWQTALAREAGFADRTIRRWLAGKIPIGPEPALIVNRLLSLRGKKPTGQVLHHVTMNNGHLATTSRAEVQPQIIEWLRPMVTDGKGSPKGIPLAIERRMQGAALFTIGEPAVVMCGLCWAEQRSPAAWSALQEWMRQAGMSSAPAVPPPTPWLGVLILPTLVAVSPEIVLMLGDLERCLAWTIIETD